MNLFNRIKSNWFQVLVIVILALCYFQLRQIRDNTFLTANLVDSKLETSNSFLSDLYQKFDDGFYRIESLLDK